ncbi:MAG: tetratricopeptide repeat protein [Alphaproteobacteria bacterium]
MSSVLIILGVLAASFGFGRCALAWFGWRRFDRGLFGQTKFASSAAATGVALMMAGGLALDGGRDLSNALGVDHPLYQQVAAAEGGDPQMQYFVGNRFYDGGSPFEQDFHEAAKWLRLAARQGHAKAMVRLAELYEHGKGVERSHLLARVWNRKAAIEGAMADQASRGREAGA